MAEARQKRMKEQAEMQAEKDRLKLERRAARKEAELKARADKWSELWTV